MGLQVHSIEKSEPIQREVGSLLIADDCYVRMA